MFEKQFNGLNGLGIFIGNMSEKHRKYVYLDCKSGFRLLESRLSAGLNYNSETIKKSEVHKKNLKEVYVEHK